MAQLIDIIQTGVVPPTETVEVCPFCHSRESEFLFWNFDRIYHLPGKFGTIKCSGCGLIRLSPRPTVEAIGVYYPNDYSAYQKPEISVEEINAPGRRFGSVRKAIRDSVLAGMGYETEKTAGWKKMLTPLLTVFFKQQATYDYGDRFPRFVPGGKALEIGCGTGRYLNFLKYHGWDVTGVDLSEHAVRAAKKNFGIDVFHGQLQDAPFPAQSFDYIHLSHVVEHFFDPLETLAKVRSLLKPDGIAYIEVPNGAGIGAQMSGEHWFGWDAPRHLFMFTPATLKAAVGKAGLGVVRMKTKISNEFEWAAIFAREDARGKKLEDRTPSSLDNQSAIKWQNIRAKMRYWAGRGKGDGIACWVTVAKK